MGYETFREIGILIKCLTNTKMCKTQYYLLFLGSLAIIVIDLMWGNFVFSSAMYLLYYPYGTLDKDDSFISCFQNK